VRHGQGGTDPVTLQIIYSTCPRAHDVPPARYAASMVYIPPSAEEREHSGPVCSRVRTRP
jgi:hypothetical protein